MNNVHEWSSTPFHCYSAQFCATQKKRLQKGATQKKRKHRLLSPYLPFSPSPLLSLKDSLGTSDWTKPSPHQPPQELLDPLPLGIPDCTCRPGPNPGDLGGVDERIIDMNVSKNRGVPYPPDHPLKMVLSILNHPFNSGTPTISGVHPYVAGQSTGKFLNLKVILGSFSY